MRMTLTLVNYHITDGLKVDWFLTVAKLDKEEKVRQGLLSPMIFPKRHSKISVAIFTPKLEKDDDSDGTAHYQIENTPPHVPHAYC